MGMKQTTEQRSNAVVVYGTLVYQYYNLDAASPEPVIISGYKRVTPPGNSFPYALPAPGARMWGLLVHLTGAELAREDTYEGCPDLYTRERIEVETRSGDKVAAWIYVPARQVIDSQGLEGIDDEQDSWLERIANHPCSKVFPELGQRVST